MSDRWVQEVLSIPEKRNPRFKGLYGASPVDTTLWTRENLAWLAGVIEGEGCISVFYGAKDQKWITTIRLGMTDEDVVRRVARIAGFGSLYLADPPSRKGQPLWVWSVRQRAGTFALLVAIYPWLGQRRGSKAREAISMILSHVR